MDYLKLCYNFLLRRVQKWNGAQNAAQPFLSLTTNTIAGTWVIFLFVLSFALLYFVNI